MIGVGPCASLRTPVLLSTSVLLVLAVLHYISRDAVREAGRPPAPASSLPGPVEIGAPGALRYRRLAGGGNHEGLLDNNEAKNIVDILQNLSRPDLKRLAQKLEQAAGKDETKEGENAFTSFQCPGSWTGWLLCNGEKWTSWVISLAVINPVAYPVALLLLLALITVGQWYEFGVQHQRWAKWLSAIVVANVFFNYDDYEYVRSCIGVNTVFVTLMFSAVTSFFHAGMGRTARAIKVRQDMAQAAADKAKYAEQRHIFVCDEEVHVPTLDCPTDLVVGNKYMLLTKSFFSVCLTFFVQSALFLFFLYEVHEDDHLHKEDMRTSYFRWLVAVGIVNVVSDDQLGGEYDAGYWRLVLSVKVPKDDPKDGEDKHVELTKHSSPQSNGCMSLSTEWHLRSYMSFLVNGVFRAIILCMAPVLLSQAGPMEFIKDCLAVFFVTTLDDISEKKSMIREIAYSSSGVCKEVEDWCKDEEYRPITTTGGPINSATSALLAR